MNFISSWLPIKKWQKSKQASKKEHYKEQEFFYRWYKMCRNDWKRMWNLPLQHSHHLNLKKRSLLHAKFFRCANLEWKEGYKTFYDADVNLPLIWKEEISHKRLVKKKLKGRAKRVRALQDAWRLYKITRIELTIECISQIRKGNKFKKMSV